jgi:hypothetical protein
MKNTVITSEKNTIGVLFVLNVMTLLYYFFFFFTDRRRKTKIASENEVWKNKIVG